MHNINSIFDVANSYGQSLDSGLTIFLFKLVALIAIAWGLANCFLGFKIQRVITAITAGVLFGFVGKAVTTGFSNQTIGILVGLVFAGVFGFIAFKFYKQMLVFLIGAGGFAVAFSICQAASGSSTGTSSTIIAVVVGLLVGVAVGFVTLKIYKPLIIIATALQGGLIGGYALYAIFAYKGFMDFATRALTGFLGSYMGAQQSGGSTWLIIALILIVTGIIFQFKTAGRKIKDVFAQMKKGTVDGGAGEAPLNSINSNNKFLKEFYLPLGKLTAVTNIQYFYLGSAVLALLSLFQIRGIGGFITCITVIALFTMLFLGYTKVKLPDLYVNITFAATALIILIDVLFRLNSVYAILQAVFVEIFIVALWLALVKNKFNTLSFVICGGLAVLHFLIELIAFKGFVNFISLAIICSSAPIASPYIKTLITKYKAEQSTSAAPAVASSEQAPYYTTVDADPVIQEEVQSGVTAEVDKAVCQKCGAPLTPGSGFCHVCGTAVGTGAAKEKAQV